MFWVLVETTGHKLLEGSGVLPLKLRGLVLGDEE